MEKLNLKNLKITDGVNEITDKTILNKKINDSLKNLTKLKRLCLRGIKISDISFLKYCPDLIELDILNTEVTTGEKNSEGKLIGLEVIEESCSEVGCLLLNYWSETKKTDITKIPLTVKNCLGDGRKTSDFYTQRIGFYSDNLNIVLQIGSIPNMETISFYGINVGDGEILDLSRCSSLTKFSGAYSSCRLVIKFPPSLTRCSVGGLYGKRWI